MVRIVVLLAVLLAVLFVCPAYAVNDFKGQTFFDVAQTAQKHGVKIEQLNDADTAALDEALPSRPLPSTIYLLTLGDSVIVVLVADGEVIFSSNPVALGVINKALHRVGA